MHPGYIFISAIYCWSSCLKKIPPFGFQWQDVPPQMFCVLAQQRVASDSALDVGIVELKGLLLSRSSLCWHSDEPQQAEERRGEQLLWSLWGMRALGLAAVTLPSGKWCSSVSSSARETLPFIAIVLPSCIFIIKNTGSCCHWSFSLIVMRVSIFYLGELLIQFPVVLCNAVLEVFWPNGARR